MTVDDDI